MSLPASQPNVSRDVSPAGFNPLKIIIPVLLALLSISLMSQWYANNISFPRYCKQPEVTLQFLHALVVEDVKIDNDQRRQYMIAAKLLFLYPKESSESSSDYMLRMRQLIMSECR